MDQIKTVTKQELRDLILKCCRQCISADITELDFSFTPFYIEVKIPEEQQPSFEIYGRSEEISEITRFGKQIESYSFGNMKLVHFTVNQNQWHDRINKKLLSIDIAHNYQIEE